MHSLSFSMADPSRRLVRLPAGTEYAEIAEIKSPPVALEAAWTVHLVVDVGQKGPFARSID